MSGTTDNGNFHTTYSKLVSVGKLFALSVIAVVYAEEATPEFYLPDFGEPQPACAVALRVTDSPAAPVSVDFRPADLPPATFDDFISFLEGNAPSFSTSNLILRKDR